MRTASVAFGALVLVSALAGCSATAAVPTPSPSSTPITVTGSTTLTPPKGTRSADVTVTCTGSRVGLTVGTEPEPRVISCASERTMTVPVGPTLALNFDSASATSFTATVRFSPSTFRSDTTLTAQCAAATTAVSDILSADNGLVQGAITSSQAQTLTAQAAQALAGVSPSGVAGKELATLRAWLIANPTAEPTTAPMPSTLGELCTENESPLLLTSSYGG